MQQKSRAWGRSLTGGIYFYNDDRATTPWGDTRPDYGRSEVRQYILANATMWLDEYHVDGLRFDGTVYIRTSHGPGSEDLPAGWGLLQAINTLVAQKFPDRITIAEDLQNNKWLTKDVGAGGAGFGSQWDSNFVHPIRQAVITPQDEQRSLASICDALCYRYNDDAFDRVIYSESHDEVANGQAQFTIADDGCGFDPNDIDGQHHLGLSITHTRAERCGGSLEVKSEAGHGTQIVARLPIRE